MTEHCLCPDYELTGFMRGLGSIRQWLVIMTDRQPVGLVCGNPKSMIDFIVAGLVAAGDVIWDSEADTYRAPHYRCFRFEE